MVFVKILGQDLFFEELTNESYSYQLLEPVKKSIKEDTLNYFMFPTFLLQDTIQLSNKKIYFRIIQSSNILEQYDSISNEIIYSERYLLNMNFPIHFSNKINNDAFSVKYFQFEFLKNNALLIKSNKYWISEVNIDSVMYEIKIFPYIIKPSIFINSNNLKFETIKLNEVFILAEKYYKINSIDYINQKSKLVSVLGKDTLYGYKKGKQLLNFNNIWKSDIINTFPDITLKKYNLFHFWGEWCHPCIKRIPKDIILYSRIDTNEVNIINVAFILKTDSKEKTINLISKYSIPGYHLFDKSEILIWPLHIETYPSIVLVDNLGKILYRSDIGKNRKDVNYLTLMKFLSKNKLLK